MQSRLTAVAVLLGLAASAGRSQPYVEDSINVYHAWVGSLCYNSAEDVVYGASSQGGVFAIDCSRNMIISQVAAYHPLRVIYNPTSNKAYASVLNNYIDSVLVIDGATHERLKMIPLLWATELVWDSVDNRVWVSCQGTNEVACIDCATDSVIARVAVGDCPLKLYVNTRHRKLYVLNNDGESVSIVSLISGQVLRTIPLGNVPYAGCYCNTADKLYCDGDRDVVAIGGQSDSIESRIAVPQGTSAWCMAENPDLHLLFLGIDGGSYQALHTVDVATDSTLRILPIPRGPQHLLWNTGICRLYSACYDGLLAIVASDGGSLLDVLAVGDSPFCQARSPEQGRVFVGCINSPWVYVIRDSASALSQEPPDPVLHDARLCARPSVFLGRTRIEGDIGQASAAVGIYTPDGRAVRSLRLRPGLGGKQSAVWDGLDDSGQNVRPGVYCAVAGDDHASRTRIVKLK